MDQPLFRIDISPVTEAPPVDPEIDPEDDVKGSESGAWKQERATEQDELDQLDPDYREAD